MDVITVEYQCASCGEGNESLVDPTAGMKQSYTEDCEVCCRPNRLLIHISGEGVVAITVEIDE